MKLNPINLFKNLVAKIDIKNGKNISNKLIGKVNPKYCMQPANQMPNIMKQSISFEYMNKLPKNLHEKLYALIGVSSVGATVAISTNQQGQKVLSTTA